MRATPWRSRTKNGRFLSSVSSREFDGEWVVLDLRHGNYFGLDETGTRIWRLIEQHQTLDAVLTALSDEYEATRDTLERDLMHLAAELSEKGLLVVVPVSGAR